MAAPVGAAVTWRFLHALPPHYVAHKLPVADTIAIDGRLDDRGWADVEWTGPIVDITDHAKREENEVPPSLQMRAKLTWDDDYLYIGAELREQLIMANVTGHNGPTPPYKDNDFEVFVDPSGTTQHYKEFEMSARNATYDVLWGVPDGEGLACGGRDYLPTCVNTSFPGCAGCRLEPPPRPRPTRRLVTASLTSPLKLAHPPPRQTRATGPCSTASRRAWLAAGSPRPPRTTHPTTASTRTPSPPGRPRLPCRSAAAAAM